MTQHFGYAVDRWYLPVLLPFGFKRDRDGVTLTGDAFEATFGFFRVTTARDNITGAHITRNYRWWTASGARWPTTGSASAPTTTQASASTSPRRSRHG
jgi:hypothetical protein